MFKLVKWAFEIGQQTERRRIAHILAESRIYIPYREGLTNDEKERRAREQAISNAVNNIIDGITNPTEVERSPFSLLFPKGEK